MSTLISSSVTTITSSISNRLINFSTEEDQLNRINLQALQNRDPYITKIIDQAQRVCVYKFLAEKREWEHKDLEGTLFVYERTCEPYHGFVILSTVSREIFVQSIKSSMEFKHSPNYEAFLQYKVDVGDIYGIWFISNSDCPRVTECLKRLTRQANSSCNNEDLPYTLTSSSSDIFSLLNNAQEKFQEKKRKQEPNNADAMPAALLRLFSTQDVPLPTMSNDEREQELKKTLGILSKPALSVTELEKQLLQSSSSDTMTSMIGNNNTMEYLVKPMPISNKTSVQTSSHSISSNDSKNDWATSNQSLFHAFNSQSNTNGRLMTPAQFETLHIPQSPILIARTPSSCCHCQQQQTSPTDRFSKDTLRQLLVDMLQNDEQFLAELHNAYTNQQDSCHRISS